MARLAQRAENEWVGVQCGIMDQLASIGGLAGHALLIDCRTLEPSPVPLPAETAVLVLDTGTRRGLVGSAYDERRRQCQEAADFFGARALRDVSLEDLSRAGHRLPQTTLRRARHVISENQRTLAAAQAMRRGDAARMGELMNASHQSLRTDFEVSSPELDAITDCARRAEGCLGARLTGAGFAGCAVALVRREDLASFTETLRSCYRAATEKEAAPYVCAASPGASVER
jgi:galactokinase